MIEPDIREPDMIKIRPRFTNKLTSQGIHTLEKQKEICFGNKKKFDYQSKNPKKKFG